MSSTLIEQLFREKLVSLQVARPAAATGHNGPMLRLLWHQPTEGNLGWVKK
jgi:hypothetical protein